MDQQTEYVSQFKPIKKLFEIQCKNVMMMIVVVGFAYTFAAEADQFPLLLLYYGYRFRLCFL